MCNRWTKCVASLTSGCVEIDTGPDHAGVDPRHPASGQRHKHHVRPAHRWDALGQGEARGPPAARQAGDHPDGGTTTSDRIEQSESEERSRPFASPFTRDSRTGSTRPGVELTRDTAPVQPRWGGDGDRGDAGAAQRAPASLAVLSLSGLDRKRLGRLLEGPIAVKTNSLFIDETDCMGMRKSMSINCF